MRSEEVGVVRGVGKRAQWILRRMAAGEGLSSEEEVQGEEDGNGEDGDEEEGPLEEEEEDQNGGDEDGQEGDRQEGPSDDGEEDAHSLDNGEALAEARKRVIASLGSAEPIEPSLVAKAVQDQPEEANEGSIELQVDAVASGPAKAEENDLWSVHATLDMIITIVGQFYGQRDLLDGRLLWEEIECMTNDLKAFS